MSRRLSLLLLWLAAAVAGLSGPAHGQSRTTGVVAFAQDDLSNDWRQAQVAAVRESLSEYPGVRFRVTDAHGDPAVQALHIERLARQKVDVLITSPADADLLDPVIQRVREQGIPVILLSRRTTHSAYTSFVHPDNRRITRRLARFVFQRLEGQGRVLMLKGIPGATTTRLRTRTFRALAGNHPGIRVASRTANYLRADAIRAVEGVVREHGGFPFDAIYAQSDSMAAGARLALRRHGIDPADLLIAGIDYIREARRAIRAGEQAVSFTYPTGGAQGARLAVQLLQGESVPREITLESRRVTAANVDAVSPIF
jgi:ribose transport system substrate-binding protein